jgi:hypothetical protein
VPIHIGQDGILQGPAEFSGFNALPRSYKKGDIKLAFELFNRLAQSLVGNKTALCSVGKTFFFANSQKIKQLSMIHASFYGRFRPRSSTNSRPWQLLVAGEQKTSV